MKTREVTKTETRTYYVSLCEICESEDYKITIKINEYCYPEEYGPSYYHYCSIECLQKDWEVLLDKVEDFSEESGDYYRPELEVSCEDPKVMKELLRILLPRNPNNTRPKENKDIKRLPPHWPYTTSILDK